jgi:hypothetical protein
VAAGQFALLKHWPQRPPEQMGFVEGQSEFMMQPTH